ncbi:DUF1294 domain-containing protein [Methanosarcina sp.]|uniref:DUF1294 domain-containing protein n=1 Tax=Methanosarcina sp. TaxID=2213 RepID=UPI003C76E080
MKDSVYLLFPIIYAVFNAASYALYGMDKFKAKKARWRISEQSLLIASLFGPIGALLGMQHFRHKTQKPMFKFLVPAFAGVHLLLVLWINL